MTIGKNGVKMAINHKNMLKKGQLLKLFNILYTVLFVLVMSSIGTAEQNPLIPGPHVLKKAPFKQEMAIFSLEDRGIGLLDKGQIKNVISNYGILSNFHLSAPALQWPRNAEDVQQYGFGVDLIILADDVLIHSIYDPSSVNQDFGWEAADGSNGNLFNDSRTEENTAADGVSPILASSDRQATWPTNNGEPFWPGLFRADLENPGSYAENEFTSDRDIYCEFTDTKDVGIRIKQHSYSYSRAYAEDFLFFRFFIHNDGNEDLDDVYTGFQADLKPDFYADDRIGVLAVEPFDNDPSFIYKWDLNGIPQRDDSSHFEQWVGPLGVIGLGFIKTPGNAGITSFHYYHDDNSPVEDETFAGLIKNEPSSLENPEYYFHGSDSTFDDVSLWEDVDKDELPGAEITFLVATGPFSLAAGDSTEFSMVIAIGADTTDLQNNLETAYFMGKTKKFQGSGPPATPHLTAVPTDGEVRLYWNDEAESSIDALTGYSDFEGYRLYKSYDRGLTWGEPVTNWWGDPISFLPIFQCDIIDSIIGLDPAYSADFPSAHAWLGDDTGLRHSYIDTDVTNGVEVWYSLTSYDRGVFNPEYPDSTEPSYETGRGVSPFEQNVASVVPGTRSSNIEPFNPYIDLHQVAGQEADGKLEIEVINEFDLTGHSYRIEFTDTTYMDMVEDTLIEVTHPLMTLIDLERSSSEFTDNLTNETFLYMGIPLTGDGMPVVDGFRINALNVDGPGLDTMYWSVVNGEECTFDWWTEDRHPDNFRTFDEIIEGWDDWKITITEDSILVPYFAAGFGEDPMGEIFMQLEIERIPYPYTDSTTVVSDFLMLSDLRSFPPFADRDDILGPLGWDLVPGGAGYNPHVYEGTTDADWPDMLVLGDDDDNSEGSLLYLKTQNGPETAIPPSVGDEFYIHTLKPFSESVKYEFTTSAPEQIGGSELSNIKVVPNPFIVKSGLETGDYDSRVMFTHLPAKCSIRIYTVDGRKVRTLDHYSSSGEGYEYWDLLNSEGQKVAFGLYIYVVKTPDDEKVTGKLMIIR